MIERRGPDGIVSPVGAEAEPVVVDTATPGEVVLELDDGERLVFDAVELRGALRPARVVA